MKIFFSEKDNTFFNEVFHGTRTIKVPDPKWERPTITIPDPTWDRPHIQIKNPDWNEGDTVTPETIWVPDLEAAAPMIEVPDDSASPLLVVVPNPNCLLPPESELVDVPQEEHDEIFRVLSLGGSILVPGKNGRPSTAPAPPPTVEDLKNRERAIRDRALLLTDPLIARHRDELEAERPTTLTAGQYKQLQGYRQDLRDWPESEHFPALEYRPVQPAWLDELIQ